MKKFIGITYKALYSLVEAVELKVLSDQAKLDASSNEDERANLQNDILFEKAYLKDLKKDLDDWPQLPTTPQ